MNLLKLFSRLWAAVAIVIALGAVSPGAYAQSAPDENVSARLVWSTMIALDNANRTGNYSVLHALGSPDFQAQHSPQSMSRNFAGLRNSRIDVGRAIMTKPVYYLPPTINQNGELRLRGAFEYRPQSIRFDLIYQNMNGGWRLHAISVAQMDFDAPK